MKTSFSNLIGLLFSCIALVSFGTHAAKPVKIDFEDLSNISISTQFAKPDQTKGVEGEAWRTDGFSSYAQLDKIDLTEEFSISFWVILESYPSDLEVPVDRLTPASLINKRDQEYGFDIFIDTFGRWGLWTGQHGQQNKVSATTLFPLYEWVHVGLSVQPSDKATLLLNNKEVLSVDLKEHNLIVPDVPIYLAKSYTETDMINFTINRINGAYDQLSLDKTKANRQLIAQQFEGFHENLPNYKDSLKVPLSRFSEDHLRPSLHAMPPANWTNEPHGMVKKNDIWHLFYQRTPNGPYKTQMHWGHMISKDLVHWTNIKDVLRPELQSDNFGFDMKGIWSGDVFIEGEVAYAFYTSVNHFDRLTSYNPGIAIASSTDPMLETWQKHGPIINTEHVKDFRDPYIFKDETMHMIIGAAYEKHGGLDYYVFDTEKNKWQWKKRFSDLSYRRMDIGSIIWEMPVFEQLSDDIYVLVVNPIGGAVEKYGDPTTRAIYWTGVWKDGLFHPHYKDGKLLDILPGHLSPTVERADDGYLRAIGIVDERRTSQAQEDAGWAHTFSFPRKWFLMPDKRTLGQQPAPELALLRDANPMNIDDLVINQKETRLMNATQPYELLLEDIQLSKTMTIVMHASDTTKEKTRLTFDTENNQIILDKTNSNLAKNDEGPQIIKGSYDELAFGKISKIRVFVDASIIEVFINDSAAFSFRVYPSRNESNELRLYGAEQTVIPSISIWNLSKK